MFNDREYNAIELYFSFRSIPGIGEKNASVLVRDFLYREAGLLERHPWYDQIKQKQPNFKVTDEGKECIPIPIDVNVRKVASRVFKNIKWIPWHLYWKHKKTDQVDKDIQFLARCIFPEFPARIDTLFFNVGRRWCEERKPNCSECPLREVCDYA